MRPDGSVRGCLETCKVPAPCMMTLYPANWMIIMDASNIFVILKSNQVVRSKATHEFTGSYLFVGNK